MTGMPGRTVHIAQGEHAVGHLPEQMISTLLGSCVSVCLHDAERRVGGMNHILLPERGSAAVQSTACGALAMELLINDLLKLGAVKARLTAKVFGGGRMIDGLSNVGARNVDFAMSYLQVEGIRIAGSSVGGKTGRRVQFWPESGKARQKLMEEVVQEIPAVLAGNDVELF